MLKLKLREVKETQNNYVTLPKIYRLMDAYIHSTFICCDHKNPNIGSPPRHNKLLWQQQNPLKYIL